MRKTMTIRVKGLARSAGLIWFAPVVEATDIFWSLCFLWCGSHTITIVVIAYPISCSCRISSSHRCASMRGTISLNSQVKSLAGGIVGTAEMRGFSTMGGFLLFNALHLA